MKRFRSTYLNKIGILSFLVQLFFVHSVLCQKKYEINYILSGKDTLQNIQNLGLKGQFDTKEEAQLFVSRIPAVLLTKGFAAASVDSASYDSTLAKVNLYIGDKYRWSHLNTDSADANMVALISHNRTTTNQSGFDIAEWPEIQEKLLQYYENNGYPFAKISIDDVAISGNDFSGALRINKGVLYHIDSIRVYGKVKIRSQFLQHYLHIFNGDIYNNQQLKGISKKLKELLFIQEESPWNLTMLGGGSILNLYLMPKKSSQIDVLVGFLPSSTPDKKSQLTADVHLNLNNALGAGENILVNWQQLQAQSPKLNLGFSQPYLFNTKFGIDFSFNLYKQDSAYLQLNGVLGLNYILSQNQTMKVFYQPEKSYLLSGGVDTNQILYSKRLPLNIDLSSDNFGLGYHFVNTDYRFNPRRGVELDMIGSAGIKKITRNNEIINLKDPANPSFDYGSLYDSVQLKSYNVRVTTTVAKYFSTGKNSVIKAAANVGILQSPQTFQNELFRLGGYRLLRGFDEESIYANKYAVLTGEYRFITGLNSYFYGFSDVAFTNTKIANTNFSNSFVSAGIGLEFETKFGLLNLSYAIGNRNDVKFDIRNASKIHFGYINYF